MPWKKILRYFLLLILVLGIITVFLANRNLKQIYGGLTEEVDPGQFVPYEGPICIEHVHVLSPDGQRFLPNRTVCLEGGKIVAIDSVLEYETGTAVEDGTGKYLIPALTDAHVHLWQSPNDLLLYLANGITHIRELVGAPHHLTLREEIKAGRLGPQMYVASPRLGTFGTMEGWFMNWSQEFNNVKDAADAAQHVLYLKEQGYDGIKAYSHLSRECYEAISRTADSLGMDMVGHIPWSIEIDDLWTSHQSDIAHLEEIMNALRREFDKQDESDDPSQLLAYIDQRSQEMIPHMLQKDISLTTTLWLVESFYRQKFELDAVLKEVELAYVNPGIAEWDEMIPMGLGWLPSVNRYKLPEGLSEEDLAGRRTFWQTYAEACRVILKNMAAGGVVILAGTDASLPVTVPGFSLHQELVSMQAVGMSPAEVLQTATLNPAIRLRRNAGKISPGFQADLLLLNQNPLEDIRHTQSIEAVFLGGKMLDRKLLDDMLAAVKAANDRSRTIDISEFE
ncbi:MAG: amidohydrolase family protein [Bacteroidota bacterium]